MARKTKAADGKKGSGAAPIVPSTSAGGKKAKAAAPPSKSGIHKSKKDKNIFKVNDAKSNKKPQMVQKQLKKLKESVNSKREKVDSKLVDLHKGMVVKKPKTTANAASIKKDKKAPANAKKVSQKLGNLKV